MTRAEEVALIRARDEMLKSREAYAKALVAAHAKGHSTRTIAAVLGLSHGAIHQTLRAAQKE